jgi:hypothetical protein
MREYMNYSDVKKANDSVRKEGSIAEFVVSMILIRLIEMCFNETYSKVHI